MIFDTSYTDKRTTRKINEAVGLPFSWKERWKYGGIGSKRMVIKDISAEYKKYMKAAHYLSNANIELRPKGIIIHFKHKLESYAWIMPYAALSIERSDEFVLKAAGRFISFHQELDQKFIVKLMNRWDAYERL
ncbi:MAG: hypothetical protein AAF616_11855 [Bacteroidota bacterium]